MGWPFESTVACVTGCDVVMATDVLVGALVSDDVVILSCVGVTGVVVPGDDVTAFTVTGRDDVIKSAS